MSIELEHSFDVPIPPERAWEVLLDVRRVAPCMPGATVDNVDGDEVTGKIKVKVGPIALTYTGKARFTERDPVARAVTVEAAGKETRGSGTASATVHARLDPSGAQTRVVVQTSLNVTGRPAQFGRGVMSEVAGRLVEKFSANLAEQLAAGDGSRSSSNPVIPNGAASDSRLALPLEELNLPARSFNSLRGEGIATVGELVARTGTELLAIKNLGEKSVGEIEQRLGEIGLALRDTAGDSGPEAGSVFSLGETSDGPAESPAGPGGEAAGPGLTISSPAVTPNGSAPGNGTGPAVSGTPQAAEPEGSAASDVDAAMRRDEADDDALNLFEVAAVPLLKRVLPAVAAAAALAWIGRRVRHRSRRTSD
ncbi:MAG TPA: DNA-directed RNA polymerase subunit alpha C-terminal domain-containing protein [Streptosporangiaceae bacterium]|jgi:carbon monoxide dehydrogenase subunit G